MASLRRARLLASIVLLWLIAVQAPLAAPADVRLLIDVSGSMRQNDPRNLRAPALQLVNELIPAGAVAGVWLFAEQTEALIAPAPVDDAWKKRLGGRLARIHSRGLFTDIERAIRTATEDWSKTPPEGERHLILFTDGLVDVSKDASESAASRERILSEQLEALKSQGVKVHAIGLSDQIDEPLMRLLATQTGGWLEVAQDAETLQRLFLRVLEQSAPPTTVPIQGNRFEIDDQVSEFTVLAFRPEGGQSQLTDPDGTRIRADQLAPGVKWRAEVGYDLVTLSNPKPGQWRIRGVEDPDNRVVIVTDMGIEVAPVPNTVGLGELPKLESWLTDHGQPVERAELLQVSASKVVVTPESVEPAPVPAPGQVSGAAPPAVEEGMTPPAVEEGMAPPSVPRGEQVMAVDPATKRFTTSLQTRTLTPGVYRLDFVIDGGTFQRQLTRRLKIKGAPLTVDYEGQRPSETEPFAALMIRLTAEPDLVEQTSLSGYLLARGPENWTEVVEIPKGKRFPLTVKIPIQRPGEYRISSHFMGRTLTGDLAEIQPEPGVLTLDFEAPPDETAAETAAEPVSWLWLAVYVLGGNVLLGGLLALTWWLMTRSRSSRNTAGKTASGKTGSAKRTRA
ncbi:VWA domain-containing protein [Allochromatium humboldtianum]|uniref:VWA domain-containing protein n=1 Tax=Allochromatium humboldtianum TaxID=504901 RepID=A0A850R058_9GAMM|nr:VWA domain-containing protein [Allochromatium humboldtianum]